MYIGYGIPQLKPNGSKISKFEFEELGFLCVRGSPNPI